MSETGGSPGGGGGRAWPIFLGIPLVVAVAVALILLAGRGGEQAGTPAEDASPPPDQTTEQETGQEQPAEPAETEPAETEPAETEPAETEQTAGEEEPAAAADEEETVAEEPAGLGPPVLGDAGAPVVLVEYSDYQ